MNKLIKSACPLDCWDACSFYVKIEGNKVKEILPDDRQHITSDFICKKGRLHIDKIFHKQRITSPLIKNKGVFEEIQWDRALDILAEKINKTVNKQGSQGILHYDGAGSGGLLKSVGSRFFSCLGGVTKPIGSLCWGAGIQAQKYDFGDVLAHDFKDIENSKFILIWGRNPMDTNVHIVPFINRAKAKGAKVVVIDPLYTNTAELADEHISIKPSTDGALALAMANIIISNNLQNQDFVNNYTTGFEEYRHLVKSYSLQKASNITGIDEEVILKLALEYSQVKPASILIGYGLQKYGNSGNSIRAIDSLAALTGNIGVSGGGSNYANKQSTKYFNHSFLEGDDLQPKDRYFKKPQLGRFLLEYSKQEIGMVMFSRSNPMTQTGDTNSLIKALEKIDFVVTIDMVMTDTAQASDMVLPCTSFLEEENIYYTSMGHGYISYGQKIIQEVGQSKTELWIFSQLAKRLNLQSFPQMNTIKWLETALQPLTTSFGITLEDLKKAPVQLPGYIEVPWADRIFKTNDKKYNFYSKQALEDGLSPLPVYELSIELDDNETKDLGYNLNFLTPHPKDSLHSQHYIFKDDNTMPIAYVNSKTASVRELKDGDECKISSKRGSIKAILKITNNVRPDCVKVFEGWWLRHGGAVNLLTADYISDMGNQAALYDCLCKLEKI